MKQINVRVDRDRAAAFSAVLYNGLASTHLRDEDRKFLNNLEHRLHEIATSEEEV